MSDSSAAADQAATPLAADPDDGGPSFAEPWQAEVFAIVQALLDAGAFTDDEWMRALSDAIDAHQAAGDPDLGDTYYEHWLAALEALCARRGLTPTDAVDRRAEQWRRAYLNTPHGQPVHLAAGQHVDTEGTERIEP